MSNIINKMSVSFDAKSQNEGFARVVVASFAAQSDPLMSDMEDLKTAVSEGVTNAIVHGYEGENGIIEIEAALYENAIEVVIKDYGKGIKDIDAAMKPMFTSKPEEERSGLGFTVMDAFMDSVEVTSTLNVGTTLKLYKNLGITDDDSGKDDARIDDELIHNMLNDYFEE